jgi:hypothetical protein
LADPRRVKVKRLEVADQIVPSEEPFRRVRTVPDPLARDTLHKPPARSWVIPMPVGVVLFVLYPHVA